MASELMKVKLHATLSNSEADILTVASGHTYTILSITLCETANAAELFDLYVRDDAGGSDYWIYKQQAIGAYQTFEHTGRIVLEASDVLSGILASSGDVDVVVSYLDQTL
jgi:hypothetical protein